MCCACDRDARMTAREKRRGDNACSLFPCFFSSSADGRGMCGGGGRRREMPATSPPPSSSPLCVASRSGQPLTLLLLPGPPHAAPRFDTFIFLSSTLSGRGRGRKSRFRENRGSKFLPLPSPLIPFVPIFQEKRMRKREREEGGRLS